MTGPRPCNSCRLVALRVILRCRITSVANSPRGTYQTVSVVFPSRLTAGVGYIYLIAGGTKSADLPSEENDAP